MTEERGSCSVLSQDDGPRCNAKIPQSIVHDSSPNPFNAQSVTGQLEPYNLFGWEPDITLSDDENYMDLVMILTRNSTCAQGHMACLLVQPSSSSSSSCSSSFDMQQRQCQKVTETTEQQHQHQHQHQPDTTALSSTEPQEKQRQRQQQQRERKLHQQRLYDHIISAATNTSLFTPNDSDIHAEIHALGKACSRNHFVHTTNAATTTTTTTTATTQGCTAYITMPPCKRCLGALYVSGITRIVTRKAPPRDHTIRKIAERKGVEVLDFTRGSAMKLDQQQKRIERLIQTYHDRCEFDGEYETNAKAEKEKSDFGGEMKRRAMNKTNHDRNGAEMMMTETVQRRRKLRKQEKRAQKEKARRRKTLQTLDTSGGETNKPM